MTCAYYKVGKLPSGWTYRYNGGDLAQEPLLIQYFTTASMLSRRTNTHTRSVERDVLTNNEKMFDMLAYALYLAFQTWLTSSVTSKFLEIARQRRAKKEKLEYIRH